MSMSDMQGNCAGPPTAEVAQQLNLPDSGVVGMQNLHPGQCVIVVSKAAIFARKHNKWFDNLHFAIVSDTLVPKTVVAISLSKETLPFTPATNVFLTRITFHALDGLSGARALEIAPELPENTRGQPGNQVEWGNDNHAVLFQGTRCRTCMTADTRSRRTLRLVLAIATGGKHMSSYIQVLVSMSVVHQFYSFQPE